MLRRRSSLHVPAVVVLFILAVTACGSSSSGAGGTNAKRSVEASFYPLAWMAEQVGGSQVTVSSLTKPGAEPHDLELTPKDVARLQDADVIVYLSGFQPSVDDGVKGASGTVFDARPSANLDLTFTPIEGGKAAKGESGSSDPHFWLDPIRLAKVARSFAATMGKADGAHKALYRANAARLVANLDALDRDYRAGLRSCENKDLMTSHNAFGYLARRYGLKQVGITGLTPEGEPSAGDLAAVADYVKAHQVKTIYFETLVSPAIARTVAKEAHARTEVLDPIEGLNDRSQGSDYLQVMRSNLANLRSGQPCP